MPKDDTVFKRLWQSGLNAHFCGVTWNGDEELGVPDYYRNVRNAFEAAGRLDAALSQMPLAGYAQKSVLAHSLGNMVVSAALQDYEAPIDHYFMLNAAVPAKAYDATPVALDFSTNGIPRGLIHDDWATIPSRAWANMWHRHFLPQEGYTPTAADEARATLTWQGRFQDVLANRSAAVYNYYSAGKIPQSGDEVFEIKDSTPSPSEGFEWFKNKGRYSWQKQECYKGRHSSFWDFAFAASDVMGWGIEENISLPTTPNVFRTIPYFHHNPEFILSNDTSTILAQRDLLLAYGIPAMTKAAGSIELPKEERNINLQRVYAEDERLKPWARANADDELSNRWLHSDIKDVAYPFTRLFYKDILEKGDLK